MSRIYEALKRAELDRAISSNSDHASSAASPIPNFNCTAATALTDPRRTMDFAPTPVHREDWPADWFRRASI
ncbi:MAG: hypothetical protein ACLQLC_02085 [Candidatus Sulfotelmatobacter sp.]